VVVDGSFEVAKLSALCEQVRVALEGADVDALICDVGGIVDPGLGTIDALARLQLIARRCGRRVRLQRACLELQGLLELAGLSEVLPELPAEAGGQAEQGEPPRGFEEEGDPGDPVA
jgi:hypothetical protein